MKKLIPVILAAIIFVSGCSAVSANPFKRAKKAEMKMLPVYSAVSKEENKLWVGTFQLVWNDFMDEVVKGPIKFKGGNPEDANKLNKQEFKKSFLSDDSYYTAWGKTNLSLKQKIETAIMKKFGEKSAVLDKIDWNDPNNAYLFYAMLKKDFKFQSKFDITETQSFNGSKEKYPYFGIDKFSKMYIYDSVKVLFYNNPYDFAVVLKSPKDEVILYRTNGNESFDKIYADLNAKTNKYKGNKQFAEGDQLQVPYMTVKKTAEYPILCGKQILGTDLYIDKTIQTVDFNMNRRGVRLKSEAVIDANFMSIPFESQAKGRDFFFNKTFVIFMKENDKSVPYFAARVKDLNLYKYDGKID